jgi:hypothetical protein
VQTAKAAEHLVVAQEICQPQIRLQRCRDHQQHVATGAQPRETHFEVPTDGVQLQCREQPVLECRFAQAAQQRTPVVVRTERTIGDRFVVALPVASQLLLESRHRLVGPRPVPQQAGETIDRRVAQRSM